MTQEPRRINLWSGPRNVSTTLLYSFAQRADTRALDEPLYAFYLRVSGAKHPGWQEAIEAQEQDGERVVRDVILGPCATPILFMKQMAHHLVGDLDWGFMSKTANVLLVRDPKQMLPSLINQVPEPTMRDVGLDKQVRLLEYLVALGQDPVVLESRQVLENPESVLRQLCGRLGIEFDLGMLSWPAGPKSVDGVWAKHWYHNLHKSAGFEPYRHKTEPFPERLRPLLEECEPLYSRLAQRAIQA